MATHKHDRDHHIAGQHTDDEHEMGRRMETDRDQTIQLREEELIARKEPVKAGEVEISKDVVAEQRSVDVPVTREEAVIERRPVDRRPADAPISEHGEETINVPLTTERATAEKRPVVTEEVHVGKRAVEERQQVSGTVRREVADIDTEGNVETRRGR